MSCFITTPPDESAGVKLPSPSRPVPVHPVPPVCALLDESFDEKKSKKDKKDKKKKRKASEDADDLLTDLFKTEEEKKAEVVRFAAERGLTVTFTTPTVTHTPPGFYPYAGGGSVEKPLSTPPPPPPPPPIDVGYETYMAGPGNYVNAEVKRVHAQDVAAMQSDGKSLGDKKYGCAFCGAIHHLDCHTKGNDPPCMKSGAFNRFIQNFLFEFDIAPDQEWRQMLQYKVSGYRRAMAERFAAIVGLSDAEWTATLQRRAWDTRKQTFSSNAGTSRELFQQGRAGEFLFFHTQGGTTSPRPSSTLTLPSPVPMAMPMAVPMAVPMGIYNSSVDFHQTFTTF